MATQEPEWDSVRGSGSQNAEGSWEGQARKTHLPPQNEDQIVALV